MLNNNQKKLICELRKDARKKLTDIAKDSNIPVSTLFDLIKDLEKNDIIKHKTIVKFEKIGFPLQVILALKSEKENRNSLREYLKSQKCINNIFQTATNYDFVADCLFRNYKEFQNFSEDLEKNNKLSAKEYYHVTDVIQKEKFLEDIEHFE